jgi:hypothetical protein
VSLRNRIIRLARRGTSLALVAGLVLLVSICCVTPLNASPQLTCSSEVRRRLSFTRHSPLPGHDTYFVGSTLRDGLWRGTGVAVAITVTPAFWTSWWFRGIVVLLILGIAVTAYRLRVRAIKARNRELARQVAERTRELAAMNAIAAVVSRSLDLDRLLADALEKTLELMNIEAGGIYLLDPSAGVLTDRDPPGTEP